MTEHWAIQDLLHKSVAEVVSALVIKPTIFREEDTVIEMVKKVVENPGPHTLSVVDREGRLVGIIPVERLLDCVFVRTMPEDFLSQVMDAEAMARLARWSEAHRAQELMQPPIFARGQETVREAFAHMHQHHLTGLPVVDDGGRVIGYLDMLQLLIGFAGGID